jgi:hypothetical protein
MLKGQPSIENVIQPARQMAALIRKINSWFTLKIQKRTLKEVVEQRVNIVAVCYVTSGG